MVTKDTTIITIFIVTANRCSLATLNAVINIPTTTNIAAIIAIFLSGKTFANQVTYPFIGYLLSASSILCCMSVFIAKKADYSVN